ncbi:MAG TPA: hybrid sensor histidine kinase/response regulator, partial [Rheinheimera sp.]|nr:hybrid sensor histidine kinase/response regulator [Rheinheimera sp.]
MTVRFFKYLLILLAIYCGAPCLALEQYGTPLLSNYKPKDYNGGTQNWAVIQDKRGLLYVGNNVGVMEFDGANWRMIPTRNKAVVRSLALSPDGFIYVGSKGELGYLDTSHPDGTQYVSLLERIPSDYRNFQDVRQTFATAQGVYFITRNAIFLLTQQQVKVWSTNSAFLKAFWVNDHLIVREEGTGLLELVQGEFAVLPGSEYFADAGVFLLEQYNQDTLLVGNREGELFLLNNEGVGAWNTEIDAALKHATLYTGMRLSNGDFALGTTQDGVFIITANGKLKSHINTELGLVDQNVRALYQDHQQGLWLALDHGLSRIDLASAISYYNSASGLQGNVLALHQHQDTFYAGTSLGLFRINNKNRFEAITSLQKQTWDFISFDSQLLVANSNGVYALEEGVATLVRNSELASKVLYQSIQNPSRVYVGLQDGLASMRYEKGKWLDEGRVPGVTGNLNSILETASGELWLGSLAHGVFRLSLPQNWQGGSSVPLPVKRYTSKEGLPSNNRNSVHWYQNQLLVATVAGFYRPDGDYQLFSLDSRLAAAFTGQQPWVRYPVTDMTGNLWLLTWDNETGSRQAGVLFADDSGAYRWQASALQPLQDIPLDTVLVDQQNVLWFGGAEGIFRFALDEHRSLPPKPPQIRQLR